jgi:hypothetical protein
LISEWWTYRPADFLLFSLRVYERQFELANDNWWHFELLMLALGLCTIWLVWRQAPKANIFLGLFAAASLVASAKIFLLDQYAAINWLADELALLFFVQAFALLVATVTFMDGDWVRETKWTRIVAGISLYLLIAYPILTAVIKQDWAAYEAVAVAPDPTACAVLAITWMSRPRLALALSVIPLAWVALSLSTLWTLESPTFWLLALTTILAGGLILLHRTNRI